MCDILSNWGFDEWSTIATIGLSFVAILIAIWSSRSTSKSAEKQINEIKQLSALQIEISIKHLEAEIQKMMAEVKKARMECEEIGDINKGAEQLGPEYRNRMMCKYQETKSQRELQIYSDSTHKLNELLNEVKKLKK